MSIKKCKTHKQIPKLKWPQGQRLCLKWTFSPHSQLTIYFYITRHSLTGHKYKMLWPNHRIDLTQEEIDWAVPVTKVEYENFLLTLL